MAIEGLCLNAKPRVLLVEDHADTLWIFSKLLRQAGYPVLTAISSAEALEVASRESFDVLVTDLRLGDGTGWDLLTSLNQRCRLPVAAVAVSGLGYPQDLAASRAAGFVLHLTKPVTLEALTTAIEAAGAAAAALRAVSGALDRPGDD